jgi:hypothetical protein
MSLCCDFSLNPRDKLTERGTFRKELVERNETHFPAARFVVSIDGIQIVRIEEILIHFFYFEHLQLKSREHAVVGFQDQMR